jgi:hypothetical protein
LLLYILAEHCPTVFLHDKLIYISVFGYSNPVMISVVFELIAFLLIILAA